MTRQILINLWYKEEESLSFNISYDSVPLQSNEPEVNEEYETSKQPSVSTSPAKK